MKRVAELAAHHGLLLWWHVDEATAEALQLPREVAEQIAWRNGDRLFPPP